MAQAVMDRLRRWGLLLSGVSFPGGPIVTKELLLSARRPRVYLLRLLYLAVLSVVIYSQFSGRFHGAVGMTLPELQRIGQHLIVTIAVFQFAAAQVLAPMLTATAINEEINRSTVYTLLTTPLTAPAILIGKLVGRLAVLVLLIATTLPLLMLLRVFGGIEWRLVVYLILVTIFAAMFNAAVTLVYSIYLRRTFGVVALTYITVGLGYAFLALAMLPLAALGTDWPLYYTIPTYAIYRLIHGLEVASVPGLLAADSPLIFCGVQLLGVAVILRYGVGALRRRMVQIGFEEHVPPVVSYRPLGTASSPSTADSDLGSADGFGMQGVSDEPRSDVSTPTVIGGGPTHRPPMSDQPVLWRECLRPVFPNYDFTEILLVGELFLVSIAYLMAIPAIGEAPVQAGFTDFYMAVAMVVAGLAAAESIAREGERGTLELLLITPLSSYEILSQKVIGILRRLVLPLLFCLGHLVLFMVLGIISLPAVVGHLLVLSASLVFIIGVGVRAGIIIRRVTAAVLVTLIAGPLVWSLLYLLGINLPNRWGHVLILANPFLLNGRLFASLDGTSTAVLGDEMTGSLVWNVAGICGAYALAGLLLLGGSVKALRRR